jgi:hypothetical protein
VSEAKIYTFLEELKNFQHELSFSDRIWKIIFQNKKNKWHYLQVQQYKETFYISLIDGAVPTLEVHPEQQINLDQHWELIISAAHHWLLKVKDNWIKANTAVMNNYPTNCRQGYVPHAVVRGSLPDILRLDHELGKENTAKFIKIYESGYFFDAKNFERTTMTTKIFFDYCKIAYLAAQKKDEHIDEKLSGLEMYKHYADGRHEGLLDLDLDSEEEFAAWLDGSNSKRDRGGHPWEIKRGGNTTHIDLSVTRPRFREQDGFIIKINAPATTRLAEAIRMFLSLYDAAMPITISDNEGIVKRLLAQDNIGIVPYYASLHRANQGYPEDQNIYDVMYYDDFGKHKTRINPFIIWHPLSLLIPKLFSVEKI